MIGTNPPNIKKKRQGKCIISIREFCRELLKLQSSNTKKVT